MHEKEFVRGLGLFSPVDASPGKGQFKRKSDGRMCGGQGWSGMYRSIVKEMKKKRASPEEAREHIKTKWTHAGSKDKLQKLIDPKHTLRARGHMQVDININKDLLISEVKKESKEDTKHFTVNRESTEQIGGLTGAGYSNVPSPNDNTLKLHVSQVAFANEELINELVGTASFEFNNRAINDHVASHENLSRPSPLTKITQTN